MKRVWFLLQSIVRNLHTPMPTDREKELAEKLESVRRLAKENPEVDESKLMEGLLLQDKDDYLPSSQKTRAYLVSFFFPPFGLYYVIKFYFGPEKDARKVAFICLGITVSVFILGLVLAGAILSSVPEIDQVSPDQINDLIKLYR